MSSSLAPPQPPKVEHPVQGLPPTRHNMPGINVPKVSDVARTAILPGVRRHLRGRRGGLKDMPTMPLDVLFEIFGFMHPRDLLNLARTTREFRALLMSKQSANFWKHARKQIEDLPEPPYYLSEPQYANLLFFPHCHNCLKPNIQTVIWVFSARYCKSCQRSLFMSNNREVEDLVWQMVTANGTQQFYPLFPRRIGSEPFGSCWKLFRQHDGKMLKHEVESVRIQWAALKNEEERERFVNERRVFVMECLEYADRLGDWKESYQASRSFELDALRAERLDAIKARLRDEGWAHVVDGTDPFLLYEGLSSIKSANRPVKLTDKAWKGLRKTAIEVMEALQVDFIDRRLTRICEARLCWIRMVEERLERTYNARLAHLKTALDVCRSKNVPRTAASDREPGFAEVAHMPAFRNLIVQEQSDDDAFHASLQTMLDDFSNLTALWAYQTEEVFAEKALEALGDRFEDVAENPSALLDLAIVSFVCTKCNRTRLRWPGILAHLCFRVTEHPPTRASRYERAVRHHTLTRGQHDAPFRGGELSVFDRHVRIARAVISACGLDPDTATFDQVEASGARFVYWCNEGWQKVYDWQALIRDLASYQDVAIAGTFGDPADHFRRVSDRQAQAAIEEAWALSANGLLTSSSDPGVKIFGCALCVTWGRLGDMQSHLRMSHDVRKAESELLGPYLYLHEDSKPRSAPEVWLPPEMPEEIEASGAPVMPGDFEGEYRTWNGS